MIGTSGVGEARRITGDTVVIDGSEGEGGGQMLRAALGLSVATGRPFRMLRIRAGRAKPGLLRQHLACVHALAAVGNARVVGGALGSEALEFWPGQGDAGPVRELEVGIGSAGSTLLVVQALLPALLVAPEPTRVTLDGGTHAKGAPPLEHSALALAPALQRLSPDASAPLITLRLERHGFYPAGGGRVVLDVHPAPLRPLPDGALDASPGDATLSAEAVVSGIPDKIAHRELKQLADGLPIPVERRRAVSAQRPVGPGNAVMVVARHPSGLGEVFTAFGERKRASADVADDVVREVQAWRAAGAWVGEHLADQLVAPVALAGGGSYAIGEPTLHTRTVAHVVERFLPVRVRVSAGAVRITPR